MTMPTPEADLFHAYLDDELPASERAAFAARMNADARLSAAVATEQQFRTALRARVMRTHAPASLQRNVRIALTAAPVLPWWQRWWHWLRTPQPIRPLAGVAALLFVVLFGGGIWMVERPTAEATQALALLFQRHELYFENQPALDVTGNATQIRIWFTGRVPYRVQAPALSDGWQLTGARLDEFQQQRTAHLLYIRGNGQRTSLTIFPRQAFDFVVGTQVHVGNQEFWVTDNGIHRAILWHTDQIGYALIGDVAVPEAAFLQLAVEAQTQLQP